MTDKIVDLPLGFDAETPDVVSPPKVHLVLLLHGILSISDRWLVIAKDGGRFEDLTIVPKPISYAIMYPWDLLRGRSEARLRLVSERIEDAIKRTPHDVLCIHCHSYGTKIFSQLSENLHSRFDWIFFAGSICHFNDDRKFHNYFKKIVNDCGKRDIFPVLATAARPNTFGHTGVVGFHNPPFEDRFFAIGHSHATGRAHFDEWIVPVLRTGKIPQAGNATHWVMKIAPDLTRFGLLALFGVAVWWYLI